MTTQGLPVYGEYDVLVIGGGPAGVAAAFAAARKGMKTLIVEQFNCLGGVAGAGGHGHISRYDENQTGRRIVGGVAWEIVDRVAKEGFGDTTHYGSHFEVEGLKLVLDKMAEESGCEILYYTFFCETIVKDNKAVGAIIQNKSGRQMVYAKQLIDCTGDGDVAASAGCEYEVGRPTDSKCQPVTLMFTIGGVDYGKVCQFIDKYHKDNPEDTQWWKLGGVYKKAIDNGDMRKFQTGNMGWWWCSTRPDFIGVNFTHIIYTDSTKAEDLTAATIEGRKQAYETIEVYRKYIDGMQNCYMVSTPNTIGLRESRRIMGEYKMNEEEVKTQATFDDAIGYGSFFVDIHCIDGPGMDPTVWRPGKGFKYQIPYGILVPKKIDNLLVAGRCVSCTHIALGSLRVMATCMVEGEAAALAAVQAIQNGKTPRTINVKQLQADLKTNNVILDEQGIIPAQKS